MTIAPKFGQLLFIKPSTGGSYVPLLTNGDVTHQAYEADAVERPVVGVEGKSLPDLHATRRSTTGFAVGLVGSGTAGVAPVIGPLLKACAMAEVVDPDTTVTYTPLDLMATNTTDSCSIRVNESGEEQEILNNRGTVTLTFPSAGIPKAEFTFTGDYDTPYAEAFPQPPSFGSQSEYKIVNNETTLTLLIGEEEYPLCFETFSVVLGAETTVFALGGCVQEVRHTAIMTTWSATAVRPAIDDLNLWEILEARDSFNLLLEHGPIGQKVSIELTGATLNSLASAQINNTAARTLAGDVLLNGLAIVYS